MSHRSLSNRIIEALNCLEQFSSAQTGGGHAVNVLSGAVVSAVPDDDVLDHGLLTVTFPGGAPIEVNGSMYLQLQVIEFVRFERYSEDGWDDVRARVQDLVTHLHRKFEL